MAPFVIPVLPPAVRIGSVEAMHGRAWNSSVEDGSLRKTQMQILDSIHVMYMNAFDIILILYITYDIVVICLYIYQTCPRRSSDTWPFSLHMLFSSDRHTELPLTQSQFLAQSKICRMMPTSGPSSTSVIAACLSRRLV